MQRYRHICMVSAKRAIALLVITVFLSSCSTREEGQRLEPVFIDFDNIQTLCLSVARCVELETNEASVIASVDRIQFINNKLYIQDRGQVKAFDKNNGKYLFNVGVRGNGPGEYTTFSNFYIKDGNLHIVDAMARQLLSYDEYGSYVSTVKYHIDSEIDLIPGHIFPLSNGTYISRNMFRGVPNETPVVSILDENLDHFLTIQGRTRNSGFSVADWFSEYHGEILYWETLNDTIFHIDDSGSINPRYFVDFNKNAAPQSFGSITDVYDRIDFANHPETPTFATLVKYVQHDEAHLRFIFTFDHNLYYVKYNKRNKKANTYLILDSRQLYEPLYFTYYEAGQVYFSAYSMSEPGNDFALFVFDDETMIESLP